MDWIKDHVLELMTILLAGAALFVSIRSYNIAKQANKTSKDALKASEKQFLEVNRPYLLIEPVIFKDTNSYFKIEKIDNDIIKFNLKYKITNKGNVIIKDIVQPDVLNVAENQKYLGTLQSNVATLSLNPGQQLIMGIWYSQRKIGDIQIDEYVNGFHSGKNSLVHAFPIQYHTELDPSIVYKLFVKHKIHNDRVELLKSEMDTIKK